MTTSRTHTATHGGPVTFDVRLTAGTIYVRVEDRTHAEVTVSTADDSGPAADAVRQADIADGPGRLAVQVRDSGGGTVLQNVTSRRGGMTVVQTGGTVYGSMTGVVVIDGVVVSGGGNVIVGGSDIQVTARLPLGSSITSSTTSADVVVDGPAERVRAQSVSGDVRVEGVADLDADTTSGDVRVEGLAGSGRAKSVSGDITVRAAEPSRLRARTVSGDVRVTGARVDLDASTVSGRVSQR